MYIAIVKTENNRVVKFQEYAKQGDCKAHVKRVKPKFPDAFVYNNSAKTPVRDLKVTGATVTVDPVIDPSPPTKEEIYNDVVKNQKVLKALALVCAEKFNMTPAQMKSAIKAKM